MPCLKKAASAVGAALIAITTLSMDVFADEAYTGYSYDWWGDPIPSQNGYVVDRVINGADLGLDTPLNEPNDIFILERTGEMFLADTKNNRIIVTDVTFDAKNVWVLDTFTYAKDYGKDPSLRGKKTTLNAPMGVFVLDDGDKDLIYIADHENSRVLACDRDGVIWMEYTRPSGDLYDASISFKPNKVLVDHAKNVYVNIKATTQGAVVFSVDGSFNGYYGANRVQQTAEVLANAFWKMIYSRDQIMRMRRSVSAEFSNFDIDKEGFIYTVTEGKSATTDVLKKLNPAGNNIFTNMGYDGYIFGDYAQYYWNGATYKSSIVDVDVSADNHIHLLDFTTGRVFQYNEECELLFIFGGKGQQKGLFTSPSALETYGERVYVLDARKNSITVFKQTQFGEIVHTALKLYSEGRYDEAKVPWEEVLKRDSNFWFAYIGIGKAYLENGEFETAMEYFYRHSRSGYNRAYKEYRADVIRSNFNTFMLVTLVVILVIFILKKVLEVLKKRRKATKGGK